ncbi:MAG: nucleotidyltransferase domain-containing protein [Anaerolineae bacterium]
MLEKIGEQALEERLRTVVQRIVEALDPERIVLFGSHAYGAPGPDSDVDLLIIMESDERPAAREAKVSRLLRPRPFPVDILVRTPAEVRYRLQIGDYFFKEILARGKVLYERGVSERVDR